MRRAAALIVIVLSLLVTACGTKAQRSGDDDAQVVMAVRQAVPSIEAYYQDHSTYVGATLAKLRRYDSSIAEISIVSAGKETYCYEAFAGKSSAFKNGPAAEIMLGSCSDPNSGTPYNPPPSNESPDALTSLRSSIPSIEAYYVDHNTYAGMTLPKLRQEFDYGLPDIRIVRAEKKTYCVEISVDGESVFKAGPTREIENGTCPT